MSISPTATSSGFPSLPLHAAFPSTPALFKALAFRAGKIRTDEDRVLFTQGDGAIGLYIVRSGTVQATLHAGDGAVVAIFLAARGAILGLPALVSHQPYSLTALAREGSDIAFISIDDFEDLLREAPGLYLDVLSVLAAEVHAARSALANA